MSQSAASFESPYEAGDSLRRYADRLLETTRVEYVDEGVLLVMAPAGFSHRMIIEAIVDCLKMVFYTSVSSVHWATHSENFQWDLPDGTERFYVPDLVVTPKGARNKTEEQDSIALIVEVTSPKSPDTVLNDRQTKPRQYAKAGVPLYLLVDQELGTWTLHALAEDWQLYQVAADGHYGEEIKLPAPFGFSIPTDEWPAYTP